MEAITTLGQACLRLTLEPPWFPKVTRESLEELLRRRRGEENGMRIG